jgi:tetrahydromethanopterin S-methyltransferase subunit B
VSEAESIKKLSDPKLLAERAPAYELAFVEALDGQERAVNELRSRSSVLIAAAAITKSFFGDHLGVAVWIAIAAFALVGLAVPVTG